MVLVLVFERRRSGRRRSGCEALRLRRSHRGLPQPLRRVQEVEPKPVPRALLRNK